MAILIKNADVPKCCKECKFKYAIGCRTYTGFHHQDTERAAKCPLVEVWDDYQKCIEALPSAQPEIIMCKDCNWYGRADKRRFYRGMDCLQKRIDTIVPDKDFCSKAERRTDDKTNKGSSC